MSKLKLITLDYDMTLRRTSVTKRDGYVLSEEGATSLSPLNVFPWSRPIPMSMEELYTAPTPPTDLSADWDMAVVHYSNDWAPLGDFSEDYMEKGDRLRRDALAHTRSGRSNWQKDAMSLMEQSRSQAFTTLVQAMTIMGVAGAVVVLVLALFGGQE